MQVAYLHLAVSSQFLLEKPGEAHSGGAVFIGPFPIIFGTDRKIIETLLIACIIIYLVVIVCMLAFGFLKFKVV